MPRVTPSSLVQLIDRSFPELAGRETLGTLDRGSHQVIATLVALVDALGADTLASLSEQQHIDLLISQEYLRATAERWNYPPNPGGPNILVANFAPLRNRHPVTVVREVMRNCPEEPIAVAQSRLSFIADAELEQSIATDISSAEGAMADGRFKNACVMAGAALEALLLWAVQRRPDEERLRAFRNAQQNRAAVRRPSLQGLHDDPRRWTLEQYIEVARHLPVLSAMASEAALLAKDFRNLIHPGRVERTQMKPTRGSAAQAIAAVALAIEDLANRGQRGDI